MSAVPPEAKALSSVVSLVEVQADRIMNATRTRLLPTETAHMEAEELSRRVAAQLSALPEQERNLLRHEIVVAVHDLEGLVDALQTQMNTLANELRKVSSHTSAATAYGRTDHRPGERA